LAASLTPAGWAALAAILAAVALILAFVVHKVIAPMNRLRSFAEALASARLGNDFVVPELGMAVHDGSSNNEVHRLAGAIGRLGHSLKYVYDRFNRSRE